MDSKERGKLLRERFKKLGGHSPDLSLSRKKVDPSLTEKRSPYAHPSNLGLCLIDRSAKWVKKADNPATNSVRIKRTEKVSPLIRISENFERKKLA